MAAVCQFSVIKSMMMMMMLNVNSFEIVTATDFKFDKYMYVPRDSTDMIT